MDTSAGMEKRITREEKLQRAAFMRVSLEDLAALLNAHTEHLRRAGTRISPDATVSTVISLG